MNDEEAATMLARLADEVPVGEVPIDSTLATGRRSLRHRRTFRVFGASVAAAALATSGVAFQAGSNRFEVNDLSSSLAVPPGTRLVGFQGVAVAVPNDWGVSQVAELECQRPLQNTVVFAREESFGLPGGSCALPERKSSLHLISVADEDMPPIMEDARPAGSVDGVDLFETSLRPRAVCNGRPCRPHQFNQALMVPGKGVLMYVNSPRKSIIRDVLSSVRIIPEGYTAVPDLSGRTGDSQNRFRRGKGWPGLEHPLPGPHRVRHEQRVRDRSTGRSVVPVGTSVRATGSGSPPHESKPPGLPPTQKNLPGMWRAIQMFGRPVTGAPQRGDNPNMIDFHRRSSWIYLGGYDGCNWLGGHVDLGPSGAFSTHGYSSTLRGCVGPRFESKTITAVTSS